MKMTIFWYTSYKTSKKHIGICPVTRSLWGTAKTKQPRWNLITGVTNSFTDTTLNNGCENTSDRYKTKDSSPLTNGDSNVKPNTLMPVTHAWHAVSWNRQLASCNRQNKMPAVAWDFNYLTLLCMPVTSCTSDLSQCHMR
jgi:hypothetical protein